MAPLWEAKAIDGDGEDHRQPRPTLLMEAREEKQLLRFRKQIQQLDLPILYELGYVPTGKGGDELLFDVLSTAYEWQSLVVSTWPCLRSAS